MGLRPNPRPPPLFALIIGIDDYTQETGFDRLKGAVHDADSIRNWLNHDLRIPLSQIEYLQDKAATRKAIIGALGGLSTDWRIRRDDPILIYYAGHGTEAPAPKRWHWDSPKIQMIVPWDFKHPDGPNRVVQAIPDRTLGALLTTIAESKGNNITVIFDSCHSGPGTRSKLYARVRGGPHDADIPADLDDDIVLPSTRKAQVNKVRHHGLESHVLLAACAPHDFAHENRSSGAFTRALLRALHGINPTELTYEDLIGSIENLQTYVSLEHPQEHILHKRLIIAGAGVIHGISNGSKFAIWKSRVELRRRDPLAIVTVDSVRLHESLATLNDVEVDSNSLVALLQENSKPQLLIHVPEAVQSMGCFKNLISENEGRRPLSLIVVKNKALASIGLTYLDECDKIGLEMLNPEEQGQKIRHTIDPVAEDLHGALDHLCHYYYHRDRVNTKPQTTGEDEIPFSSKFTVEVFKLQENGEEIYLPNGPNLNIHGTGVELFVGSHNEENIYGFRVTNHTEFPVFLYLFYFDSSDFSITPIYQPVAVAQTGAEEPLTPSLLGHSSLTVGYGSADGAPRKFAISDENLDLSQGYLRLYVSRQYVDLSTLEKGPISDQIWGISTSEYKSGPAPIWDAITVPVVLKRGEEPASSRLIGSIVYIAPCITLPGSDGESLTLVDLPAVEDENIENHTSVLKAMAAYLGVQYQSGCRFASLVWCYNISKPRFTLIDRENFNLVKDISGPNALKNVVVLTTNWNRDEGTGEGTNVATKPQAIATAVSPFQRYEEAESLLKSLVDGGVEFKRFGTFSDSVAREEILGASVGDPLEWITSMLSKGEEVLQVQSEACETRKLVGTTAGKRLRERFGAEIEKKQEELWTLVDELQKLGVHDTERNAIQEEKEDAEQDILRWRTTLEEIEMVNSAFVSHTLECLHLPADGLTIGVRLGSRDDGSRAGEKTVAG
ncbi:hypothetical protein EST38_g1392 [Candolleomyces aberdarensis]|uniref:Peptidase C14 caspase domain-containing protein n=1 Tax=Candolleomyces aberdarensis TaxID=2316362 RepID=A0A4Q2DVX6_9AGAR|nr:hypothetical protein EST38_g1392 [Candolleomyces aberdarensis]